MNDNDKEILLTSILNFFNHPFFIMVGGIATLASIISTFYVLWLVFTSTLPLWYRLGRGLSNRKIAIFAKNPELKNLLIDSKIFKTKNIIEISSGNDIERSEEATIFLVYWQDFQNELDRILSLCKNSTALIIYAPSPDRIDDPSLKKINDKRNAVVVNFRGRLLNDILTTMVTSRFG